MRQNWIFWRDGINREQIDKIEDIASAVDWQDATIFGNADNVRESDVKWLSDNQQIQQLLFAYVSEANKFFNVDVTDECEIQFTQYKGSKKGFYDWHHDIHWASEKETDRKVSVSILLSEPAKDFDGGRLAFDEITNNGIDWQKGSVLCFPSYLRHSVSPVTRGTRKSLVAWFSGPRWR